NAVVGIRTGGNLTYVSGAPDTDTSELSVVENHIYNIAPGASAYGIEMTSGNGGFLDKIDRVAVIGSAECLGFSFNDPNSPLLVENSQYGGNCAQAGGRTSIGFVLQTSNLPITLISNHTEGPHVLDSVYISGLGGAFLSPQGGQSGPSVVMIGNTWANDIEDWAKGQIVSIGNMGAAGPGETGQWLLQTQFSTVATTGDGNQWSYGGGVLGAKNGEAIGANQDTSSAMTFNRAVVEPTLDTSSTIGGAYDIDFPGVRTSKTCWRIGAASISGNEYLDFVPCLIPNNDWASGTNYGYNEEIIPRQTGGGGAYTDIFEQTTNPGCTTIATQTSAPTWCQQVPTAPQSIASISEVGNVVTLSTALPIMANRVDVISVGADIIVAGVTPSGYDCTSDAPCVVTAVNSNATAVMYTAGIGSMTNGAGGTVNVAGCQVTGDGTCNWINMGSAYGTTPALTLSAYGLVLPCSTVANLPTGAIGLNTMRCVTDW